MIDFKKLVEGASYTWKGLELKISEIHYKRKGWTHVMLTLDGEHAITYRHCECSRPNGEQPAVDLVTEQEWLICSSCRAVVLEGGV